MAQGRFVMSQATSPRLLTTNRNVSSLRFLKFSFPVTPYQLAGKGSGGGGGGGGRGGGKGRGRRREEEIGWKLEFRDYCLSIHLSIKVIFFVEQLYSFLYTTFYTTDSRKFITDILFFIQEHA